MGRSLRVPVYAEPTADPYMVARETIELSKRIGTVILLQVTPYFSVEVDGEYPQSETDLATSIMSGRNAPQPV